MSRSNTASDQFKQRCKPIPSLFSNESSFCISSTGTQETDEDDKYWSYGSDDLESGVIQVVTWLHLTTYQK